MRTSSQTKHANISAACNSVDFSCVITAHEEGSLIVPTLRSISLARRYSAERGISSETIVVLDNSDEETTSIIYSLSEHCSIDRIIEVCNKDAGLSRNDGIAISKGRFIAIQDGDDLVSENWFYAAFDRLDANPLFVAHPEWNIVFGAEACVFQHPNEANEDFSYDNLLIENYWTALLFAEKGVFSATPYQKTGQYSAFGYEDWHWNLEVISKGIKHQTIPGTCHFIRRKKSKSVNSSGNTRGVICRPSKFYDQIELFGKDRS